MDKVYVVFGVDIEGYKLGPELLKAFESRKEAYEYYKAEVENRYMYSFIQTVDLERKSRSRQ